MSEFHIPSAVFGGFLGGVLGYLLRLLLEHRLAKNRSRLDRLAAIRNEVGLKLKEAFVEEIDFLKSAGPPSHWVDDTAYGVLTKALDKHRSAYERFRLQLPQGEQIRLDKAWKTYLFPECPEEVSPGPLIDYAIGDESKQREKALGFISKLLEVTKPV